MRSVAQRLVSPCCGFGGLEKVQLLRFKLALLQVEILAFG
jgi:hypothetical protein